MAARSAPPWEGRGPTRQRALATLLAQPGAPASEVARALGVRHSTASYHLRRLERAGAATSHRCGTRRHYFPAGAVPLGEQPLVIAHRAGRSALVLARLRPGEALALGEVAAGLPMSKAGVYWNLLRLAGLGLVAVEGEPGQRRYRGTAAGGLPPAALPILAVAGDAPEEGAGWAPPEPA